jgi:pilus assembly protein CpaE
MSDEIRPPFGAFAFDEETFAVLRAAASAAGLAPAAVMRGDIELAADTMAQCQMTPALLVVDIADELEPAEPLARLADQCDPETRVLVLGQTNDVQFYRRVIKLGVEDYLTKPMKPAELAAALQPAPRPPRPPQAAEVPPSSPRQGRIVLVIGARGGVGAGTIACNLAVSCAVHDGDVALVDFDLQFGAAAFRLDADVGPGLADALASPERIDDLFLERAAARIGDRLFLLAAEHDLVLPPPLLDHALEPFFGRLRERFPLSVIDMPRHLIPGLPLPLANQDILVTIADRSLVGLRDAARLIRRMKVAAPLARKITVLNQSAAAGTAEVTPAELAQALGAPIDVTIPFDPRAIADAMRAGRPLDSKKTKVGGALAALTAQILDQPLPQRRRFGLLGRRASA